MLKILAISTILLQFLDAYTTIKGIKLGAVEANPFIRKLMDKVGIVPSLILTKTTSIFLLSLGVVFNISFMFYIPVAIVYLWVIYNNLNVIKKLS